MHELGLLFEVAARVRQTMQEEELEWVETIVLEVGAASGVVPRYLAECFPAVVHDTPLEKTKLEIVELPCVVCCNSCHYQYPLQAHPDGCPQCGEVRNRLVSGREFNIKEILAI